jgi:hypothetical protein
VSGLDKLALAVRIAAIVALFAIAIYAVATT